MSDNPQSQALPAAVPQPDTMSRALAAPAPAYIGPFSNPDSFAQAMKMARALCSSELVPKQFRGDANLGSALIALDMAQRIGANPLMVMQNLYVVEGRPSWSAKFLIATVNTSGRFSPLRYVLSEPGDEVEVECIVGYDWDNSGSKPRKIARHGKVKYRPQSCYAWAYDLSTGEKLVGATVTMDMAAAEGWLGKPGSKWQTMWEVMLRYRAGSFWTNAYAPEISMGLQTAEEASDAIDLSPDETGAWGPEQPKTGGVASLMAAARERVAQPSEQASSGPVAPSDSPSDEPGEDAQPATPSEWPKRNPANDCLYDSRGVVYDPAIHSGGQTVNADGSWRRKKGVGDQTVQEHEARYPRWTQGAETKAQQEPDHADDAQEGPQHDPQDPGEGEPAGPPRIDFETLMQRVRECKDPDVLDSLFDLGYESVPMTAAQKDTLTKAVQDRMAYLQG